MFPTKKDWLYAALAMVTFSVVCGLLDDYDDRVISAQVEKEAIAQANKERNQVRLEYEQLALKGQHMTTFGASMK